MLGIAYSSVVSALGTIGRAVVPSLSSKDKGRFGAGNGETNNPILDGLTRVELGIEGNLSSLLTEKTTTFSVEKEVLDNTVAKLLDQPEIRGNCIVLSGADITRYLEPVESYNVKEEKLTYHTKKESEYVLVVIRDKDDLKALDKLNQSLNEQREKLAKIKKFILKIEPIPPTFPPTFSVKKSSEIIWIHNILSDTVFKKKIQ